MPLNNCFFLSNIVPEFVSTTLGKNKTQLPTNISHEAIPTILFKCPYLILQAI